MNAAHLVFYFFTLLAATGAVAILFSKNVFKSAIYLLVTLISIAALYAMSFGEFIAVAQILVYAGGITVVIIFGIMLTTRISGRPLIVKNAHGLSGGMAGVALFALIVRYLPALPAPAGNLSPENIATVGLEIFSRYSLPFELAGLLLLIALIGAAVITSHLKSKT